MAPFEVSVVIGTFGAPHWGELAKARAVPSVPKGIPIYLEHGETLAKARNAGLAKVETEFLVNLDADDELGEGYIEAMAKGTADLRGPSMQRVRSGLEWGEPYLPRVFGHDHDCTGECLRYGNWLCIGTCVRTELAQSVGWEEFGWSEDWAIAARMWRAGGTVEAIPEAIYRAHWNRQSRNRVPRHEGLRWHREIERAVWPEEPSVLS